MYERWFCLGKKKIWGKKRKWEEKYISLFNTDLSTAQYIFLRGVMPVQFIDDISDKLFKIWYQGCIFEGPRASQMALV